MELKLHQINSQVLVILVPSAKIKCILPSLFDTDTTCPDFSVSPSLYPIVFPINILASTKLFALAPLEITSKYYQD